MVQLDSPALNRLPLLKNQKTASFGHIPVIDLSLPNCNTQLVKACEELGFFKVINHGVSTDLISKLQAETQKFFWLPLTEKEKAGPANPFGYGNRKIGRNGDVGWIEFLLLKAHPKLICQECMHATSANPCSFCEAMNEYVSAVRSLACGILELIADGLNVHPTNAFSQYLNDKESDSVFRLNHYPPCPDLTSLKYNLIGFGEHTDPQMLTVLKSNNTVGLEIYTRDGSWMPVPPDQSSFCINVGDALQVLTNGRLRSAKHRVVANSMKSRLSMIFFGAPSLVTRLTPLSLFLSGEKSKYKVFTWYEYKKAAYASRLADNRLDPFKAEEGEQRDRE